MKNKIYLKVLLMEHPLMYALRKIKDSIQVIIPYSLVNNTHPFSAKI